MFGEFLLKDARQEQLPLGSTFIVHVELYIVLLHLYERLSHRSVRTSHLESYGPETGSKLRLGLVAVFEEIAAV